MFVRGRTLSRVRIDMKRRHRNHHIVAGFTLPTIMIVSIVMFAVLATSVQFVSQSSSSLRDTYYDQLAREAAESGIVVADSCMDSGSTSWAQPLRPSSTCAGLATQCATAGCYVMSQSGFRTTYSVATPTVSGDSSTLQSTGTVELLSSDGGVVRTFSANIKKARGGGAAGASSDALSISGDNSACAVGSDGWAYCWGWGLKGILGDATGDKFKRVPTAIARGAIPVGVTVRQVSSPAMGSQTNGANTCAVGSDGWVYCWGLNLSGGLGNGKTTFSDPIDPGAIAQGLVPLGVTFRQVSTAGDRACAVGSDGWVYCWGYGDIYGYLGTGVDEISLVPVPIARGAIPAGVTLTYVATGADNSCAIGTNGWAYCWGYGVNPTYGSFGTSSSSPIALTRGAIPAGVTINQITMPTYKGANPSKICVVASNGWAYCLGSDWYSGTGSAGSGGYIPFRAVAQGAIPAGATIKQVSASHNGGCVLASNDKAYCWGANSYGHIGDGTEVSRTSPTAIVQGAIPAGVMIRQIAVGSYYACAIGSNDKAYCWGHNENSDTPMGRLGNNSTLRYSTIPIAVTMPTGVTFRPPSSTSGAGLLY